MNFIWKTDKSSLIRNQKTLCIKKRDIEASQIRRIWVVRKRENKAEYFESASFTDLTLNWKQTE